MTKTKRTERADKPPPKSITVQIKGDEYARIVALCEATDPSHAPGAMVRALMLQSLVAREKTSAKRKAKVTA
jgi:DNA-binding FadR family transcriptional regulator